MYVSVCVYIYIYIYVYTYLPLGERPVRERELSTRSTGQGSLMCSFFNAVFPRASPRLARSGAQKCPSGEVPLSVVIIVIIVIVVIIVVILNGSLRLNEAHKCPQGEVPFSVCPCGDPWGDTPSS